jgi:hypothetical protein
LEKQQMALAMNLKDYDGGHGLFERWRVFQNCGEHSYIFARNALYAIRSGFSDKPSRWKSLPEMSGEQ